MCSAILVFAGQGSVLAQQPKKPPLPKAGSAQTHMKIGKEQLEMRRFPLAVRSFSAAIRRDTAMPRHIYCGGTAYDQMVRLRQQSRISRTT